MAITVRVINGRVEEYENGKKKRDYGSNGGGKVICASTDGTLVAVVDENGYITERIDGKLQRTYGGRKVVSVQVSDGVVIAQKKDGSTEEYVDGHRIRCY